MLYRSFINCKLHDKIQRETKQEKENIFIATPLKIRGKISKLEASDSREKKARANNFVRFRTRSETILES